MDQAALAELGAWVTKAGLVGMKEDALLAGFCARAEAGGLPVARALVVIDTLHPVHEGRAFRWRRGGETQIVEYGSSSEGTAAENWRRSPFFWLVDTGEKELRRRLGAGDPADFPTVEEHRAEGMTDYIALIHRFGADGVIGEMDCVYSSWVTDAPDGFSMAQIDALRRLVLPLTLAVKCASLARIAETLVETYLGRDAGRRVLRGRIGRGIAEEIKAVLWFSDLRGFTRITDTAPDAVIPLLNDYAEAVVSSIEAEGGDVLKLIGDGILAIFDAAVPGTACRRALAAAEAAHERVDALNARRAEAGLPVTEVYLGLHAGRVLYGNIGSERRLDFTVIGPSVNEVSRIAALCRSAEQEVLVSPVFAAATPEPERQRLVSVGRYALRGVGRPQELFTLARE